MLFSLSVQHNPKYRVDRFASRENFFYRISIIRTIGGSGPNSGILHFSGTAGPIYTGQRPLCSSWCAVYNKTMFYCNTIWSKQHNMWLAHER